MSSYYKRKIGGSSVEVWDIAQAWDLGRCEAQVLQYLLRAKYKGQELSDLYKARDFINRAIQERE